MSGRPALLTRTGVVTTLGHTPELTRRVRYFVVLRTVVVTAILALSIWILSAAPAERGRAAWVLFGLIAITYGTTLAFALMLRKGAQSLPIRALFVLDLLTTALLVYVTGAALSVYAFVFGLTAVAAGAFDYRRGAIITTCLALILLVVVDLYGWLGAWQLAMVPSVRPWDQSATEFARSLGQNAVAVVALGLLGYLFADSYEKSTASLVNERLAVADLYTLHQDIVRSLPSGLITMDLNEQVLTLNQAAVDILGTHARLGATVREALPELTERLQALPLEQALRRADIEIQRDGNRLSLGISISPLRDVRDRIVGRVLNFQDLTKLKAMESSMRRAERMASVGQLAAGIAHEIRNPLASISGSIELLRQAPQASSEDKQLMIIVNREIDRLNNLITSLLEYASPRPLELRRQNIAPIIEEVLAVFAQDSARKHIALHYENRAELWVHADGQRIRQVIWNLLRNAAEAIGSQPGDIRVSATRDGAMALIEVSDTGPGVPPESIGKIFEPFFTTKNGGTGLGLATCHAIASDHHGLLEVSSPPGQGATFSLRLPSAAPSTVES